MTLGCRSFAARQWLSAQPAPSTRLLGPASLGTPAVEVRSAGEGRGKGLFATRPLCQFEQILSDAPLILMKPTDDLPELYQQFTNLSKSDRDNYLALSYHADPNRDALLKDKLLQRGFGKDALQEMANVAGIMQTNAFNVDLRDGQGSRHRAMFPNIARINHSCAPNAHVCFFPGNLTEPESRMVVHTLRALQPGEEVLIAYFSILLPRSERQARAQKWGFTCLCPICTGDDNAEAQREAIRNFNTEEARLTRRTKVTLKDIKPVFETGSQLLEEIKNVPELHPALPDLYGALGALRAKALTLRDRESHRTEMLSFLELAVTWEACITGIQSVATQRRLNYLIEIAAEKKIPGVPEIVTDEDGHRVEWIL